ncbi:MAG: protein-L-isoaspartate O-methyltransferase [Alphaproteobacteria bacterium]|nr:protein-L-isoaspartate O-methyltransferase [Alphaproteobacteria bacterium]
MDHATARYNMVERQLRPNRVTGQSLLRAFGALPRESFLGKEFQDVAYVDDPVPLGGDRYLMAPLAMARLLEAAQPGASDLALVIGCATGYGAAVLSYMVGAVVALESDSAMAGEATETLTGLGIDTVAVVEGDLSGGYPDQAPYDVIFFEGAVPEVPEAITAQLAEGGRLVAIFSGDGAGGISGGKAVLISRHHGVLSRRSVFEMSAPPLPGFEPEKVFAF